MLDKISADEIYTLIVNERVRREMAISLIENYGLRQQREYMDKLRESSGCTTPEIEERLNMLGEKLDDMLNKIVEGYIEK